MNTLINIRKKYVENIKKELLGPGSEYCATDTEHEIISSVPEKRYSIGVLYPQNQVTGSDNDEVQSDSYNNTDELSDNEVGAEESSNDEKTENQDNDRFDDGALDEEIGLALQNMPSSMGITFIAQGNSTTVNCRVEFATYRKTQKTDWCVIFKPNKADKYELPLQVQPYVEFDKKNNLLRLYKKLHRKVKDIQDDLEANGYVDNDDLIGKLYLLDKISRHGYIRVPHSIEVKLDFSESEYVDNNKGIDGTEAKLTALRKELREGIASVTLMLVNSCDTKNGDCLFQSKISVNTDNNDFILYDYSEMDNFDLMDDEEQSLALLYRKKKIYSTGLGVSADWKVNEDGQGEVFTEYFPIHEIPKMDFSLPDDSGIDGKVLSMKYLSDLCDSASKNEKIILLKAFVDLYRLWINGLEQSASQLPRKYSNIARKHLDDCLSSFNRMSKGICILENNDKAWSSFELANRAMFMQRAHISLQETLSIKDNNRYDGDEDIIEYLENIDYNTVDSLINDPYSWRPFQLAFLLLSIPSIVEGESTDKEIVDLIWFPTGGGKTEAYLGLTAFTVFFRRLAFPNESSGTAVIMRYTLRLLTAQQFTRASTLICACEYIRQDSLSRKPKYKSYPLGDTEISIGLWIGSEHTPNKNSVANDCLKELLQANATNLNYKNERYNKFQVLKCPWCSTKLIRDIKDKKVVGDFGYSMHRNQHFKFHCPQQDCFFSDKLPIQVVDEELYDNPPTLLFATVDKFAMMPWYSDIGAFFGIGSNNRSPELIIQDELHLISGPLGTMVGLYETAIDYLCSAKGNKPKIIASTATIRRAKEQCAALYNRKVAQFPAPGLDSNDSFFAKEEVVDYNKDKFGRMYVGLMPSGKTKATMEIRSIAAISQYIYNENIDDTEKDKYWTSTVYFNSLKELGKCTTLIGDDVKDQIRRIGIRKNEKWRRIGIPDELTSRVSTTDLNSTLDKLERISYSEQNIQNKIYASSVLLATNMISVGIDVARLNVMLMVGQPKLTSEYIQASSRIGRKYPGVAFVLYDASKSRDRSHYEQFKAYHESFYRFVEPTGATPFSEPALDRALHAVIITVLRYLNSDLSTGKGAALFNRTDYASQINSIKEYIVKRNRSINAFVNPGMQDNSVAIENKIDDIIARWESLISQYSSEDFTYGEKYLVKHPDKEHGRLMKVYNTDDRDEAIDTMSSMRSVDTPLDGNILVWKD